MQYLVIFNIILVDGNNFYSYSHMNFVNSLCKIQKTLMLNWVVHIDTVVPQAVKTSAVHLYDLCHYVPFCLRVQITMLNLLATDFFSNFSTSCI